MAKDVWPRQKTRKASIDSVDLQLLDETDTRRRRGRFQKISKERRTTDVRSQRTAYTCTSCNVDLVLEERSKMAVDRNAGYANCIHCYPKLAQIYCSVHSEQDTTNTDEGRLRLPRTLNTDTAAAV